MNKKKKRSQGNHQLFTRVRIFFLIVFLFLMFSSRVFAFQFEEYRWGRPMSEVKESARTKGKILNFTGDRSFSYFDSILDEDCKVMLEFTPQTKVLSSIKINWVDKNVGEDLKKLLVNKYGDYQQPNVFVEEYFWYGGTQYDSIVLNYDYAGTSLVYFGGRFQEQYEQEFKELVDRERSRF